MADDDFYDQFEDFPADMNSQSASVARGADGEDPYGTFNSRPLTFAIMEFLENSDSTQIAACWEKFGAKDVSPLWPNRRPVPSFKYDPATVARWPEFQRAMVDVEADWYYWSGHHSCKFVSDNDRFPDDFDAVNRMENAGFFNHQYHDGRWSYGHVDAPEKGRLPNEVFMTTALDTPPYEDLGPEDNPCYDHVHEGAKGLVLVGCNSLVFRASRAQYCRYFPNAVVIGLISKENASIQKIVPVFNKLGRSFFEDPHSVDPVELFKMLCPKFVPHDRIAVISKGKLYTNLKKADVFVFDATGPIYQPPDSELA